MKRGLLALGIALLAVVGWKLSASSITQGSPIVIGTFSAVPPCVNAFTYYTTDAGLMAYCNGSKLAYKYGPVNAVPTTLAATTPFNGPTAANVPGGITLTATAGASTNTQARLMPVPTTPYVQIGCMETEWAIANAPSAGVIWTDGTNVSTSKIILFGSSTFDLSINVQTGVTGMLSSAGVDWGIGNTVCLALQDDGTTSLKYAFSIDRQNWTLILTTIRTAFLTPTEVGVYVNTGGSNTAPAAHVFSWETVQGTLF
jgi:hypothetical protein